MDHPYHCTASSDWPARCLALLAAFGILAFITAPLAAQTVVANGLVGPIKIASVETGTLVVSETGTTPNTGQLTRVDTESGETHTLIAGLPSGFDSAGAPAGPTQVVPITRSRVLLLIGEGDVVRNAETPGSQMPNPEGWSSPIFSSILDLQFSNPISSVAETFSLSLDDHFTLANQNEQRVFSNGEWVKIELVDDFRDLVPDPATTVRGSNTFGMAVSRNTVFVVDSGQNQLTLTQRNKGVTRKLTGFAPVANPLPFGPPVTDAVPTSVRFHHPNQLLVALFTGFPFAQGSSSIVSIDLWDGTATPYLTGLTNAIDVLPIPEATGRNGILVLEFSADLLAQPPAPGRLLWFEDESAAPVVLAGGLLTPTSVAYEQATGRIFVSELATGHVLSIEGP